MEKTANTKAKQQFSVVVSGKEVFTSSSKKKVDQEIVKLQEELHPVIILLDHQQKESKCYSKTIHQRNYRLQAGNYEKDSVLKPSSDEALA